MNTATGPLLTPNQLAERWGPDFPPRRIRRMCEREVLPGAFRNGTRWLIPLTAVRAREGAETPAA